MMNTIRLYYTLEGPAQTLRTEVEHQFQLENVIPCNYKCKTMQAVEFVAVYIFFK